MSDENDAGAAYLAALKRSTAGPATGAAAAPAPDSAGPPPTTTENGVSVGRTGPVAEKRKSPRYRCQGRAQLREINSGAAMWATFSDISLHGCYVEAAAGYPVGSAVVLMIEVNAAGSKSRQRCASPIPASAWEFLSRRFRTKIASDCAHSCARFRKLLSSREHVLRSGHPQARKQGQCQA